MIKIIKYFFQAIIVYFFFIIIKLIGLKLSRKLSKIEIPYSLTKTYENTRGNARRSPI